MTTYTWAYHDDGITALSFANTTVADITVPYLAFKLDTTAQNSVTLAGAGDEATFIGVHSWENIPNKTNDMVGIKCLWFTPIVAGWTVAVGTELKLASGGKFVEAVSTNTVVAIALEAADADEYLNAKLVAPYVKA